MEVNWRSREIEAQGFVAPGFEALAAEFERNFTERSDLGAGFAAVQRGATIVSLWGGEAAPGVPWAEHTLQVIFSGTKGLMAACILKLMEQNKIGLEDKIAAHWPEFAQHGKELVRLRHVVSHSAGMPGVMTELTEADWADGVKLEGLLAAQPLSPDPDAFRAYHSLTIGWLLAGLIRRIDGRTLGRFFHEEFARPLGLDTWIGLPEENESRVGKLRLGSGMGPLTPEQLSNPVNKSIRGNPMLFPHNDMAWNTRRIHAAEIGGAGGISDAHSLARFYCCMALGGTLDGVTVLQPDTIDVARKELSRFTDRYTGQSLAFGTVWAVQTDAKRFGPPEDAFGHSGAGGSIHGAWPRLGLGFSYTMNELRKDPEDQRTRPLLKALFECASRKQGKSGS